jgi:hypothetical protein
MNCQTKTLHDGAEETSTCETLAYVLDPNKVVVWLVAQNQAKTQEVALPY